MLLMRGKMTKFMLTNIFGEPNDYTLELWVLIIELNLTMVLRMMLEESFDITLARLMSMDLMLTRFLKMYLRKE